MDTPTTSTPAPAATSSPMEKAAPIEVKEFENLYEMAVAQFERAADMTELNPALRAILSQPKNEIIVNFPVRMDDGSTMMAKGYRIQHNNILGCYKGGLRFSTRSCSLEEVKALVRVDDVEVLARPTCLSAAARAASRSTRRC